MREHARKMFDSDSKNVKQGVDWCMQLAADMLKEANRQLVSVLRLYFYGEFSNVALRTRNHTELKSRQIIGALSPIQLLEPVPANFTSIILTPVLFF